MKIGLLVCVLIATVSGAAEKAAFEQAQRIGERNERAFFLFSTSIGHYVIRHDGTGEGSVNSRRRVFYLKVPGRIERVYFHEHHGELVLLYEVSNGTSYIGRMNQQTRKIRWLTPIQETDVSTCVVEGDEAHCGATDELTKINLNTGLKSN